MNFELEFLNKMDLYDINEMYDEHLINQLDEENVKIIYKYLLEQGMYYAKDIFIERMELFVENSEKFIEKFEKLKLEIGKDFVEIIIEDSDILDELY